MQGEQDRRFGLREVDLGLDVRCWTWRETLEKSKDAFSFLTLLFSPLLCVKVCLQFNIFSHLNTIVFAVLLNTTLDITFGSESVRKRHFGSVPVVCIWVTVLIVLPTPTSVKSEVQMFPWSWDKKISVRKRVSVYFFWNFEVHKVRKLYEGDKKKTRRSVCGKETEVRFLCNLNLGTWALKSIGYHKVSGNMMRLGNTGVKIDPDLLLPALKAKICLVVVIFWWWPCSNTVTCCSKTNPMDFIFCLFHPRTCTLFGRGTGCNEISTGLTSSHYSFSSSRNSGSWKEKKIICGTWDFLSD